MPLDRAGPAGYTYAAWILAGVGLVLVLVLKLLPAMLAGMLVYELVHLMAPVIRNRVWHRQAKLVAVVLLAAMVVSAITAGIAAAIAFFRSDAGSLSALLTKLAEIVAGTRETMPSWLVDELPDNPDDIRDAIAGWFRVHAKEVQSMGEDAGRVVVYALVGMIVGAMVALHEAMRDEPHGPLATALIQRATNLVMAFRRVVFAQVRISLINTFFTAVYLMLILPAFGVHLPLRKSMIAVTFFAGLLPVIGNLISNSVVVIVGLSHSFGVAFASLGFLILIHKLEYFLNARIIGHRIGARTWELLVAMLVMEAAFGIGGVIAAPIYYAFIKDELVREGLI